MEAKCKNKLELLFAHLSLNNISYIKPILFDAIDEYQNMCSNISYEDKKKINFIKYLLFHTEREEWSQARSYLTGAQQAYQQYLDTKLKLKQKDTEAGYAEIHGASRTNQTLSGPDYLFKDSNRPMSDNHERRYSYRLSNGIPDWGSRPGSTPSSMLSWRPGYEPDEQGPSYSRQTDYLGYRLKDYPGSYANPSRGTTDEATGNELAVVPIKPSPVQSDKKTLCLDPKDQEYRSKIAARLSDVYKWAWPEAMAVLRRKAVMEETAVRFLLHVLMETYRLCLDEAQTQILEFETAALNILTEGKYTQMENNHLSKRGNKKFIMQYRKDVAELSVKRLQDQFLTKILPVGMRKFQIQPDADLDSFVRKCISVTWDMAIQDPPLHLVGDEETSMEEFDMHKFQPYTRVGKGLEYVVWPAIFLYKDGPLLCQGFAQGNGCT